jgi:uncharacterized membrane protein (GlpM family)
VNDARNVQTGWKALLGGLVTALIVLASKRGNVLPGILPLAPTFAVIGCSQLVRRMIQRASRQLA